MNHVREIYAGYAGEKNDCAVRALSIAADIPYFQAHSLFRSYGRPDNRGTLNATIDALITENFNFYRVSYPTGDRPLLWQFAQLHAQGSYLVLVRGHAIALREGAVHDWREGPRRRVIRAYKIIYQIKEGRTDNDMVENSTTSAPPQRSLES